MTTKTIKTILFASLIAAMILPFSAMEFAQAAPNETANEKTKEKIDKFEPQPETIEEALSEQVKIQNASLRGENLIGKNNEIDTDTTPHPMKKSGPGEEPKPLTPEPGGATDNYFGSHLNKSTSSMAGAYSKNEVHDNGYTLADGTTLYAPTLMSPGNGSLEIVTAYYNPSGATYGTLDKLYVYDHVTDDWEYSDTIDSSFMNTYTSGGNYYAEVMEISGTWYAKIYNFDTSSWETLHSQSSDGSRSDGWYIWEEDGFSSGCPTVDPEIEGDLLKVLYNGNWVLATSTYSNTYDTGLPCSFSGTWDNNYYNWRVND